MCFRLLRLVVMIVFACLFLVCFGVLGGVFGVLRCFFGLFCVFVVFERF